MSLADGHLCSAAVGSGSLSVTVEGAAENYPDFGRELAGLSATAEGQS